MAEERRFPESQYKDPNLAFRKLDDSLIFDEPSTYGFKRNAEFIAIIFLC